MNEMIKEMISLEWEMFHNVNGETRVDCQDERPMFELMRNAQFSAWNEATCKSYLEDLKAATAAGKNLCREKYIHMMKSTDPAGYDAFKKDLPEITEKQTELTNKIWDLMLAQTEKIREKYPLLALGGRPLHTSEENGWPSVESYQKSELLTFSEKTLQSLFDHIVELQQQGVDLAYKIQENSVLCLGYKTMEQAEMAMAGQIMEEFGMTAELGDCPACSVGTEVYSDQDPNMYEI